MKTANILAFLALLSTLSLNAQIPLDTIILITGSVHEVIILDESSDEILFLEDGVKRTLPSSAIKEIINNNKVNIEFTVDHDKKEVYIHHIFEIPGKTKEEIHNISKEWIIEGFRDAQEVIQLDDRERGKLIGKGTTLITTTLDQLIIEKDNYLRFVIKIDSKDGKARIKIENMTSSRAGDYAVENYFWTQKGRPRTGNKELRRNIERSTKSIVKEFVNYALRYDNSEDDDW